MAGRLDPVQFLTLDQVPPDRKGRNMHTTLSSEFQSTFDELLQASNLAHTLRSIAADFETRADAATQLFHTRIDMAAVRSRLN